MRRLVLWVEYCGEGFSGFQRLGPPAPGQGNPRHWKAQETVQAELECKLSVILGEPIKIWGSGRTDRGVHATSQVVACDTGTSKELESILASLNAVLCQGLRAVRGSWAASDFHPRFSALERTYHYYLWPEAPPRHCFLAGMCWMLPEKLDLEAVKRAALPLLGSHDFSAYTRCPEPGETRTRELRAIEIQPQAARPASMLGPFAPLAQLVCLEVRANAFLRRMVRQLVANLVEVGRGRWPESLPHEILLSRDATRGAPPAPAQGLFLVDIRFGSNPA
ncbi:MAG: tRNA pseudouridine synthase A [Vulcanimicrobiota bacterium]